MGLNLLNCRLQRDSLNFKTLKRYLVCVNQSKLNNSLTAIWRNINIIHFKVIFRSNWLLPIDGHILFWEIRRGSDWTIEEIHHPELMISKLNDWHDGMWWSIYFVIRFWHAALIALNHYRLLSKLHSSFLSIFLWFRFA